MEKLKTNSALQVVVTISALTCAYFTAIFIKDFINYIWWGIQ